MPLDHTIYGAFAPKPKSIADYENEHLNQLMTQQQVRARGIQNQLMTAQAAQAMQGLQDHQTFRNAVSTLGPNATDDDRIRAYRATGTVPGFAAADSLETARLNREKTAAQADKDKAETEKTRLANTATQTELFSRKWAGINPLDNDAVANVYEEAVNAGFVSREKALADMDRMRQMTQPQRLSWYSQMLAMGLSSKEQADLDLRRATQSETARHNAAGETNQRATLDETTRAHRASEGISVGNLNVSRRRLAMEQSAPKGVVTQTDQGPMIVNPRDGTAVPVIGPDRQPVGQPLKALPAPVNEAIITNAQSLASLKKAMTLTEGKDVGTAKGDAAATGWKGFLPQSVLNRIDPSGVDTRAEIADIGSLKIHDRSGAAVTVSESPRLMPFIPNATDSREAAQKKLKRLFDIAKQEQDALAATYGREGGYKPSPVLTRTDNHPADIRSLLDKYGKYGR